MIRFFRNSDQLSRRSRKTERWRKSHLNLEQLEQRLALSTLSGLDADDKPPHVLSVSLPKPDTYGTGSALTFKLNFNEPVRVAGNKASVYVPVEVGYAMRQAQYLAGSGSRSLTFRVHVTANDVDTDGISLGRVNSSAVRDFDFAAKQILDRDGHSASNAIPPVNTSRIRVDATGPVVSGYSNFATRGQQVSLQVTFDGPVFVTGKPTVPVTIGGKATELQYRGGSGTSKLSFAVTLPKNILVTNPTFRGENDLPGEVILLPKNANLKDRLGNSVTAIGSNYGETYEYEGNRVVVIGAHYEKLASVSQDELKSILNQEQNDFRAGEIREIKDGKADYWAGYMPPVFAAVKNEVDLFRVTYRSTIPEQGNRPTVAYGLVAIPKGATGSLPLVSYQHGTLVLKESAPSQAFSWDKNDKTQFKYGFSKKDLYDSAYESRLNVAQFGGNGYAVILADYFGLGNSVENDSFFVKGSAQQATLDMHAAAQKLFSSLNLRTDKLFLNGWSQGGLVTVAFQEALEARGVKIDGVSTAAAPANTEMGVSRLLFNPRPYSTVNVPDASWVLMIPQLSAFSLGGYGGKPGAALEIFGGNYDFARKFYMREFKSIPSYEFKKDLRENVAPVVIMDGITRPARPSEFIAQRFGQDPQAYETTIFAGLMREAGAGKTRLESDMKMYYGTADEGVTEAVATIVPTWQQGTFGKTNIETVPVPHASHRGAVLSATYGQLEWFDIQRGAIPSGIVGSVNPVTGVPTAVENLTVTPVGTGQVLLDWSPAAGATSYKLLLNGQTVIDRLYGTYRFFDNLNALNRYTFSVVPMNASGSGPETTVEFGPERVDLDRPKVPRTFSTVGLDGSIWVAIGPENIRTTSEQAKWGIQEITQVNGQWMPQSPIWLDNGSSPIESPSFRIYGLATGLDGSIWVAGHFSDGIGLDYGVIQVVKSDDGTWTAQSLITTDNLTPFVNIRGKLITIGKDDAVWICSYSDSSVQRIAKFPDGKYYVDGPAISVDKGPSAITTGQDGSIWVSSYDYGTVQQIVKHENGKWGVRQFGDRYSISVDKKPVALTVGLDGSIWVGCRPGSGSVQRIVNENGSFFVKGLAISVEPLTQSLITAVDGSIWVGGLNQTIQHIVNERGQWFVKGDPIKMDDLALLTWDMTVGVDGSIWITPTYKSYVKQFLTNPSSPTELVGSYDLAAGKATLSWNAPAFNGGTPVLSYAVTARQGSIIQTDTNWGDTAYTFSGLDFSKGPVYFTVAATNFAGTSPVATLLIGQDGKTIDTTHLTTGITTDGTWVIGDGFDTLGQTYSWEALGSGKPIPFGNVRFDLGSPNQPGTIIAAGQSIEVPQGAYSSLNLAGAAVYYGAQPNLVFTLNYTDGTTETWTQSISDWVFSANYSGEQKIATSSYYNRNDGTKGQQSVNIYGYSRSIPQGKTLKSITLPQNQNVRILDIKMGN